MGQWYTVHSFTTAGVGNQTDLSSFFENPDIGDVQRNNLYWRLVETGDDVTYYSGNALANGTLDAGSWNNPNFIFTGGYSYTGYMEIHVYEYNPPCNASACCPPSPLPDGGECCANSGGCCGGGSL